MNVSMLPKSSAPSDLRARAGLAVAVLVLGALAAGAPAQPLPACVLPIDPVPVNPPLGRPTELFPQRDHLFVHSSTHLQGAPDDVKIAAGLIHRPPAGDDLSGMTSALTITNTSNTTATNVTVQFFDHMGVDLSTGMGAACPTQALMLLPEETRIVPATPIDPAAMCGGLGVGSARVTVATGEPPIVGAVIHHTYCFFGMAVCDTDSIPMSFTPPPGATAMEQLQSIQPTTDIWAGPFPLTASATEDVLNGMAPIISVTNPNPTPVIAALDLMISIPGGGTFSIPFFRIATIPANGTWIESTGAPLNAILGVGMPPFPVGLWQQLLFLLLGTPATDLDISVRVRSLNDTPILGNVLFTDFFADSPGNNLLLGERFRMASTLLQGRPNGFLENPEFTFEVGATPLIETYVMLANVGSAATSVGIEYFDNTGALMSVGSIPSLAPNQAVRIVPGAFGYPAGPVMPGGPTGFGWMRIRACNPSDQLIGWSVREILDPATHAVYQNPNQHEDHFMKAYGEILMTTAAGEPGNGYPVTIGAATRTRKLSPLIRVEDVPGWPGYSTAVNDSVANLFAYEWRIFDLVGNACGTAAFPGLPFRFASWTYEDPITLPACTFFGAIEGSASIDVSTGTVIGIDVIGDPMREWNIPDFADGTPPPIGGGGGGGDPTEPDPAG